MPNSVGLVAKPLTMVATLAARHPDATVIALRAGGDWEYGAKALRRHDNVLLEIGGNQCNAGGLEILVDHVGPDRVVWGTDSVFNPTISQIAAMRAFTIPQAMQDMYGYPALTPPLKAKIFGLNAAPIYGINPETVRYRITGDEVDQLKMAYRHDRRAVPMPHPLRHLGPRNRREFLAFKRLEHKPGQMG